MKRKRLLSLMLSIAISMSTFSNAFSEEYSDINSYDMEVSEEAETVPEKNDTEVNYIETESDIESEGEETIIGMEDNSIDEASYDELILDDTASMEEFDSVFEESEDFEELYEEGIEEITEVDLESEYETETENVEEDLMELAAEEETEDPLVGLSRTGESETITFEIDGTRLLDAKASAFPYTEIKAGLYNDLYKNIKSMYANPGSSDISLNFTPDNSPASKTFSASWLSQAIKKKPANKTLDTYLWDLFNYTPEYDIVGEAWSKVSFVTKHVIYENPEYYWIEKFDCGVDEEYKILKDNSLVLWVNNVHLIPREIFPGAADRQKSIEPKIQNAYNEIVNSAKNLDGKSSISDLEFLLSAHDYIIKNTYYDEDKTKRVDAKASYSKDSSMWTIDPVFYKDNGGVVCEGYSKALKALCDRKGIDCKIMLSKTHAWNAVKVGGAWYTIDVTWDDDDDSTIKYNWFLCREPSWEKTQHILNTKYFEQMNIRYPSMSKSSYSIFRMEVCNVENSTDIKGPYKYKENSYATWKGEVYDALRNEYLTEDVDFKVVNKNKTYCKPGTYFYKIKGIGKYSGETFGYLTIVKNPKENASGHKFSKWETIREATSKKDGLKKRVCKYCGKEETQKIKSKNKSAKQSKGITKHKHKWGKWKVTKKATKKKAGKKSRICKTCGKKQSKTIPKLKVKKTKSIGYGFSVFAK